MGNDGEWHMEYRKFSFGVYAFGCIELRLQRTLPLSLSLAFHHTVFHMKPGRPLGINLIKRKF